MTRGWEFCYLVGVKNLLILLCAACLAGCATTPTKLSDSQPIRADRFYPDYKLYAKPLPHGTKIVVVRDDGVLGSAVKAKVSVDGHELAGLFQHDRLEFYVTARDHILAVEPAPNLGAALIEHQFVFHPDETSYFRVGIAAQTFDIIPTTQIQ